MKLLIAVLACIILCVQPVYCQKITDTIALKEVYISADKNSIMRKTQPLDLVSKGQEYLSLNRGSSLMNSLDRLPGVSSMQIGQGFSKPMIRGLGFNRVAVMQNGIKQQGQQWGADHGLEIDQYDVENLDIYKGAASLQYGSDAIAGVIAINPTSLKEVDGLSGMAQINGSSNNRLFGGSIDTHYQKNKKYVKGRITHQNFEDYRVPAKSFDYLNGTYPIHNKMLKNTAGRETDFSLQGGIASNSNSTNLLLSNVYSKTGFFAGAHGIPTAINLEDDGRYRDIGLPYQRVNHLKAILNQSFTINERHEINIDLGYQNNDRKEFARPHTHGTAQIPDGNLELELKLQTGSINMAWLNKISNEHRLTIGLNTEYQNNRIGGFSFLLPSFEQTIIGIYAIDRFRISDKLVLTSGIRYDRGRLQIDEFVDQYLPDEYKYRSTDISKNMGDISFSTGVSYNINPMWEMKANLGKSFRMPTPNELSSNGVHHGTFRHEIGDKNLKAEKSYQADYSLSFRKKLDGFVDNILLSTSLFSNYFSNFIFMNPTGDFSWLPDAGQYYKYEQSKVLRMGGEIQMVIDFSKIFRWETSAEYIYAEDLDSKYPIPFTPPFGLLNELSINIEKAAWFQKNRLAVSHRYASAQNRVTKNELSTPGYNLFDATVSTCFSLAKQNIRLVVQAQNLFNTKSYNHLSFYRRLDLPEIGRNFRLSIQVPISIN